MYAMGGFDSTRWLTIARVAWNEMPEHHVAAGVPGAGASLREHEAIAAAAVVAPLGEDRVVEELEIVDVIRADTGLDDVHVHVLGHLTAGIRAGTNGVEAIAAFCVGARPATQAPMPVPGRGIDAGDVRVVRVDDDARSRSAAGGLHRT